MFFHSGNRLPVNQRNGDPMIKLISQMVFLCCFLMCTGGVDDPLAGGSPPFFIGTWSGEMEEGMFILNTEFVFNEDSTYYLGIFGNTKRDSMSTVTGTWLANEEKLILTPEKCRNHTALVIVTPLNECDGPDTLLKPESSPWILAFDGDTATLEKQEE